MKYLVVLVFVVLLARIDWILNQFDRLSSELSSEQPEIQSSEIKSTREFISVSQDASLKQTPRQVYLALLEDFRSSPEKELRLKAMEVFKQNPTIFTEKLDKDLEATVFRWRDLLRNNRSEVTNFLIDLLSITKGENQEMVKRFFSLWMEINMEHFLAAYVRTNDSNCMIAGTIGDNIPEEEKINEYNERLISLKNFLAKENADPAQKALAANCVLVLNVEISKLLPQRIDGNGSEEEGASP